MLRADTQTVNISNLATCCNKKGCWPFCLPEAVIIGCHKITRTLAKQLCFSSLVAVAKVQCTESQANSASASTLFKQGHKNVNTWKIAPWCSQWFEEILVLIWLALTWLDLIWLALIWVAFLSKFLLFSLNIHNLGTHLAHPNGLFQPNGTFTHCFTTVFAKYPFWMFLLKMIFQPSL